MKTRYLLGLPFVSTMLNLQENEFLLDTGFNGSVLLPKNKIQELNLKPLAFAQYALADGSIASTEVFEGEIEWLGNKKQIAVIGGESDLTLIGMELLHFSKTVLNPSKKILRIENP